MKKPSEHGYCDKIDCYSITFERLQLYQTNEEIELCLIHFGKLMKTLRPVLTIDKMRYEEKNDALS